MPKPPSLMDTFRCAASAGWRNRVKALFKVQAAFSSIQGAAGRELVRPQMERRYRG